MSYRIEDTKEILEDTINQIVNTCYGNSDYPKYRERSLELVKKSKYGFKYDHLEIGDPISLSDLIVMWFSLVERRVEIQTNDIFILNDFIREYHQWWNWKHTSGWLVELCYTVLENVGVEDDDLDDYIKPLLKKIKGVKSDEYSG